MSILNIDRRAMTILSDPFIKDIRKLCIHDPVMNQLINNTISWADVPSDDDILELEGWRAYEVIKNRAKSAYHRTVRNDKKPEGHRHTVKHATPQPPMGRMPYHIMRQSRTNNIILSNGRVSPVKEIIDVVCQTPVEYEELEIVEVMSQHKPAEIRADRPHEMPTETNTQTNIQIESPITAHVHTPVKRPSKGKINKKDKKVYPTVTYQPSFVQLYINPYLGYLSALLLCVLLYSMKI